MGTVLFLVYLAGVCEAVQISAFVALGAAGVAGFFGALYCSTELDDMTPYWKFLRIGRPYVIVAALIAVLAPSKQLLYIAAGLKAGKEVAQTELAQKAYGLLDKRLTELLGEKKEGDK